MTIDKIKIFIPTKGRADKQKTYKILTSLNLKPVLVVEPQEEKLYGKYEYILLPKNNQGIAYSRNYILEYSRKNNFDYIVMIDDDVNSFSEKNSDGKLVNNNECFLKALNVFIENKYSICGLEYRQVAWCQNNKYTYNHSIEVCMMMYLPNVPENVKFDPESKEDKDFAIQMIKAGCKTVKMNDYSFSVPEIGTNAGGLNDWYKSQGDKKAAEYMLQKWGENIITLKDKCGRIDAMVNWKNIKSNEFDECALF